MIIIAQVGINHNGKLKEAKKLVTAAKKAGADAVRFQTFWNLGQLEKYELTKEEWIELKEYCDEEEIKFLSTPYTLEAIDFLDDLVSILKVASPFLTDKEFILKIASKKKTILLSTGSLKYKDRMAPMNKIKETLGWIPGADVILLHCVSKYPCEDGKYDRIEKLKQFGYPVGLSDHTKDIEFPIVPVIEKHFMINENCIGASVSLNPKQFKQMVKIMRRNENLCGG